jgi:hypothetical protein
MNRSRRQLFPCLTALIVSLSGLSRAAENESRIVAKSPSGDWRVELKGEEFWIVSAKNAAPGEKLPVESAERAPVEFHFSPDEKWIFTLPDGGSCMRPGDLFHRNADGRRGDQSKNLLPGAAVRDGGQFEDLLTTDEYGYTRMEPR